MFLSGFLALLCLAVSSAHPPGLKSTKEGTFDKLPVMSCDKSLGVLCIPDACNKTSCSAVKDSFCIADRCGCEARWFQFQKPKLYKDVTATCGSFQAITDFVKFLDTHQDEDAAVAIKPDDYLLFFRKFNSLTSDALQYIVNYMKKFVKENPTKESIERFEIATALLKTLDKSKKVFDEAAAERSLFSTITKYGPTALKVGKAVYGALKSDEQNPENVLFMDEDTGEMIEAKINWKGIGKGVLQFGKGVISGVTSDETADEAKDPDMVQERLLKEAWGIAKPMIHHLTKDEVIDDETESALQEKALPRLCAKFPKLEVCLKKMMHH